MNENPETSVTGFEKVHAWIQAMESGSITPADQADLEQRLLEDADFRRLYLRYAHESALLHFDAHENPVVAGAVENRGYSLRLFAALAAAILIAAGMLWTIFQSGEAGSGPQWNSPGGVAVLAGALNVQWQTGPEKPESGTVLTPGVLQIVSGLLQIEFFSGATLVVEGPAEIELISADQVICRSGRLRAHVPPQATGFTLLSTACRVVDLGTEFGLEVQENGATEVHVFDGEVRLENRSGQALPRSLQAGEARRLQQSEAEQSIALRPDDFADPAVFQRRVAVVREQRKQNWQQTRSAIRSDPSVIVFYDFEDQNLWDRTLKNRAAATPQPADGAVIGARWAEGRWNRKGALEFKSPGDRVRMDVPGRYESMSFMAWVRFDGFDRWLSSLLLTDGWESGEPHWQVSWDGEVILGVSGTGNHFSSRVLGPEDLGRWMHLVTVYDAQAAQVRHYIDGREVGAVPIQKVVPLVIGPAEIGNWGAPMTADHRVRNLNGRIDEFAVFSRVLTAEQIAEFYAAGRPE